VLKTSPRCLQNREVPVVAHPHRRSLSPSAWQSRALTEAAGLSLALGAFLAGLFLGNTTFTHKLEQQTRSLRGAFVALFFATVGMLINPQSWMTGWRTILLLVGLVLVGKFVIWSGVVRLFRYPMATAIRVGIGLTQIG
jgi:monovalent cation:H+ antiporter-2, CPA2 family